LYLEALCPELFSGAAIGEWVQESYSWTNIGIFIAPKFLICRDATFSAYTKLGGRVSEKFSLAKEGRAFGGGRYIGCQF